MSTQLPTDHHSDQVSEPSPQKQTDLLHPSEQQFRLNVMLQTTKKYLATQLY